MNNIYCSLKFTDLFIQVSSRLLYNCCKAWPERVDLTWLEQNPGKLFHTSTMVQDRKDMLDGKKPKSCEYGCYRYEDQGLISSRVQWNTKKYLDNPHNPLINLQISLSNDCNLTCAYCSPEWSTSWSRDIKNNGKYIDIEDYQNNLLPQNNWVDLWQKIKQKNRSTDSRFFKLLLKEIELAKNIEGISLLGGEPLLNNGLLNLLKIVEGKKIKIVTGLGVSMSRLKKVLDESKDKYISFSVSAESTDKNYEFIRYGVSWSDCLKKIKMIEKNGNKVHFSSTVNNLSIFGVKSFYDMFNKTNEINLNPLTNRPFLQMNVLDDQSKKNFIDSIEKDISDKFYKNIIETIKLPYKEKDKQDLSIFLKEFSRRRSLSLDIFPEHFLKWLEII